LSQWELFLLNFLERHHYPTTMVLEYFRGSYNMGDKLFDLQKILSEYDEIDDFGFSAVSEEEYNKVVSEVVTEAEQNLESYKQRLTEVEKLIVPFLMKLLKTADKEYIYWPNREPAIKAQIEKIVKLTRG